MDKSELLEKMKNSRSWRELGMTIADVLDIIGKYEPVNPEHTDEMKKLQEEFERLKEKCDRLAEANKQLRAENKELKGK